MIQFFRLQTLRNISTWKIPQPPEFVSLVNKAETRSRRRQKHAAVYRPPVGHARKCAAIAFWFVLL
jgi:hypothetical protein